MLGWRTRHRFLADFKDVQGIVVNIKIKYALVRKRNELNRVAYVQCPGSSIKSIWGGDVSVDVVKSQTRMVAVLICKRQSSDNPEALNRVERLTRCIRDS